MDLSILITTRNRKKDLLECVNSVKRSNIDEKLEWEISELKEFRPDTKKSLCTELFFDGSTITLSGKKNLNLISSILKNIIKNLSRYGESR